MAQGDLIQREWEWAEQFSKNAGRPPRVYGVDRSKTAMIAIDMQNAFIAPTEHYALVEGIEIVDNINRLSRACREAGIPVIWVVSKVRWMAEWGLTNRIQPESCFSELDWDSERARIYPGLEVDAGKDHEVVKRRYSAFISGASNLERLLRTLGIDTLLVTGIATNVCVSATAMDAMMLDFKVMVVSDATAAFTNFLHQTALMNLRMIYADVVRTEEILEEIWKTYL
jgi:ureidoacrylate peracid hydrolase